MEILASKAGSVGIPLVGWHLPLEVRIFPVVRGLVISEICDQKLRLALCE